MAGILCVVVEVSGMNRHSGFMAEVGLVSSAVSFVWALVSLVVAGLVVWGSGRLNSTAIGIMESK